MFRFMSRWITFLLMGIALAVAGSASALDAGDRFIVEQAAPAPASDRAPAATQIAQPTPKPVSEHHVPVRHYAELDRPLEFGEHFWDETLVPPSAALKPAQIVVDLAAEQLYVYRAGVEIARSRITRGWEDYRTPTGVFPILEKDADHVSSTYDNAPMPYNLRLTWPGVAIHGAEVDDVGATHGCIGVPLPFARQLFRAAKLKDKVLITRDWMPHLYANSVRYSRAD